MKVDVELIKENISSISIFWIIVVLLIGFLNNIICAYRWWYLKNSLLHIKIPYYLSFRLYYIGNFFNLFLPGSIGGDSIKSLYIYNISKNTKAVHSVIIDRLIGLLVIILFALFGLFFAYMLEIDVNNYLYLITLFFFIGLPVLFGIAYLLHRYKFYFAPKINKYIREFVDTILVLKMTKSKIFPLLIATFLFQFFTIINSYFASKVFGFQISLIYFLIIIPLVTIITLIPISFAGLGLREMSYIGLFALVGVGNEIIVVPIFMFIVLILLGLIGGYYYVRMDLKKQIN